MVYILLFVIVILLIIVAFLGFQNSKLKQQHYNNMEQLQGIISSLHQKQMLLKDRVTFL